MIIVAISFCFFSKIFKNKKGSHISQRITKQFRNPVKLKICGEIKVWLWRIIPNRKVVLYSSTFFFSFFALLGNNYACKHKFFLYIIVVPHPQLLFLLRKMDPGPPRRGESKSSGTQLYKCRSANTLSLHDLWTVPCGRGWWPLIVPCGLWLWNVPVDCGHGVWP